MDIAKELKEKKNQLKTTEENLSAAKEFRDNLQVTINKMKPRADSLDAKNKELEEINESKRELEDEKDRLESKENPDDLKAAQSEIDRCEIKLEEIAEKINTLKSEIIILDNECQGYKKHSTDLSKVEKKAEDLKKETDRLKGEIDNIKTAIDEAHTAEKELPYYKYISSAQCEYFNPETGEIRILLAGQIMTHWCFGTVKVIEFKEIKSNVFARIQIIKQGYKDLLKPLPDSTGWILISFLHTTKDAVIE